MTPFMKLGGGMPRPRGLYAAPFIALSQHRLGTQQILLGVDADGVRWSLGHIKRDAVFEQPQLLQPLDQFQWRGRQRRKPLQRGLAIGVDVYKRQVSISTAV